MNAFTSWLSAFHSGVSFGSKIAHFRLRVQRLLDEQRHAPHRRRTSTARTPGCADTSVRAPNTTVPMPGKLRRQLTPSGLSTPCCGSVITPQGRRRSCRGSSSRARRATSRRRGWCPRGRRCRRRSRSAATIDGVARDRVGRLQVREVQRAVLRSAAAGAAGEDVRIAVAPPAHRRAGSAAAVGDRVRRRVHDVERALASQYASASASTAGSRDPGQQHQVEDRAPCRAARSRRTPSANMREVDDRASRQSGVGRRSRRSADGRCQRVVARERGPGCGDRDEPRRTGVRRRQVRRSGRAGRSRPSCRR